MSRSSLNKRIELNPNLANVDAENVNLPDLLENQRKSFEGFLSRLSDTLYSFFPINWQARNITLDLIDYVLEPSKLDYSTCANYSMTFASILKIKLRLVVKEELADANGTVSEKIVAIEEQWIFCSEIPMMSESGTFLVNGNEYVVISQMHRSPGVFFDHDQGRGHITGKYLFSANLIPYKGSWLDVEFDGNDAIHFRIDKKRKMPLSTLLRACEFDTKGILDNFYYTVHADIFETSGPDSEFCKFRFKFPLVSELKMPFEVFDSNFNLIFDISSRVFSNNKLVCETQIKNLEGAKFEDKTLKFEGFVRVKDLLNACPLASKLELDGVFDLDYGDFIDTDQLNLIKSSSSRNHSVAFYFLDYFAYNPYILDTIKLDKNKTSDASLLEVCRVYRGSDSSLDIPLAREMFNNMFFLPERFDLSHVGRLKLNHRLSLNIDKTITVLKIEDILAIVKELINVRNGFSEIDDIDHLSNRRVRSIGELLENQMKLGLAMMRKTALDRLSTVEIINLKPSELIYSKFVSSMVRDFFTLSQFSQFMDQTNLVAEITHKRRISALGLGGLNRERAGFEVRDVHYTHYGRICPIETPEGQNIGLINSLSVFARIDEFGFVTTPYRRVVEGVVTDEVVYLTAFQESGFNMAEISSKSEGGILVGPVLCRRDSSFVSVNPREVDFIDVSPQQMVSVAASLIPFLESNDAARALMGSNMQRQAVPLLKPKSPRVGTSMEEPVARDSGVLIIAERDGLVQWSDSGRIAVLYSPADNQNFTDLPGELKIYRLKKFKRSNFNTSINQIPLVKPGERVKKGDVLADGYGTDNGELALGDNILIAFLSWYGFNFEDSIVVSERIVSRDIFTSVHLEEFECIVRDTRLGEEQIVREVPNISEEAQLKLDENGIIRIGALIKPGDVLVGKVVPKVENSPIPEEKLLRAIFGEASVNLVDASLYVPPGTSGVVADVKILSRNTSDSEASLYSADRKALEETYSEMQISRYALNSQFKTALLDKCFEYKVTNASPKLSNLIGFPITQELLDSIELDDLPNLLELKAPNSSVSSDEFFNLRKAFLKLKLISEERHSKLTKLFIDGVGTDLQSGVLKIIKVVIAVKSKLQPGDKMSGRHGNKGVVSVVVPVEDMPYMADGTPIDMLLSPLGIPSRMNVGQILETQLGFALFSILRQLQKLCREKPTHWMESCKNLLEALYHNDLKSLSSIKSLTDGEMQDFINEIEELNGFRISAPAFGNVSDQAISKLLSFTDSPTGQCYLYDGKTGERMERKVTVGVMYILKLHHMIDNKIHARSIGPYGLITQQPLGGRSHFGGQRFGEMECWALQAYGAAYSLQEMLTVKSDDIRGRVDSYNAIIRGENVKDFGVPESFNVIINELLSLCINIDLQD